MFKDMGKLMKQAYDMKKNMQKAQSDLKKIEIEAESGAGLVKIVMNGKYQVKKIQIDDSILNDKQMLSDLVSSAFNSGVGKVEKAIEEKMSSVAGNMNLGNMKFPF